MGWDAYAVGKGVKKNKLWEEAANRVKQKCGSVDGFLSEGGLDCSACAYALEEMTGMDAWDDQGWLTGRIENAYRSTQSYVFEDRNYEFMSERDCWAFESAKEFIKICHISGYTVEFSY